MRLRGPERSSILLLGRNTVVIGAVVIIIVGFGLGYFFGYKGGDFLQSGKEDDRTANEKAAAISDEKKALDAAPADKPVIPPPIMPPEIPQENKAQKPLLTDADKSKEAPKDLPTAKERKADKPPVFPPEPPKEKEPAQTEQASGEQTADKPQPAEADAKAKSGKSVKKTIKNKGSQKISKPSHGKLYTVQFGAFPSREGAEQLQAALKSKGIKAYIVEKSEGDPYFRVRAGAFKSKKEAGSAAVSMQKKTSIQNFVATK